MFGNNDDHVQWNDNGSGTALLDRMSREVSSLLGEAAAQDMTALVGANTEFKGLICYNGTIRIDGKVEGEIRTDGVLFIGKDAIIRATIRAGAIVSCGKIFGNVIATETVKLLAPAVLKGSVTTPLLSMEEGVRFQGNLEVTQAGEEDPPLHALQTQETSVVANL